MSPCKNDVTVLVAVVAALASGGGLLPRVHLVETGNGTVPSFHELVEELALARVAPLQVLRRADEDMLWATYRLARFMVFPSLTEGLGLFDRRSR